MNTELGLRSIVRQKTPRYQGVIEHKKFENLLKQDFTATQINQKWATDFTYLFLKGGDVLSHYFLRFSNMYIAINGVHSLDDNNWYEFV